MENSKLFKSKPTAKRKAKDDDNDGGGRAGSVNPLLVAAKKLKESKSNKRKLNGVEEIGGLRIVRAPSSRTPSEAPHPHSFQSYPIPIPTTQPPAKKFRASPSPASHTTKPPSKSSKADRDVLPTTPEEDPDPELDEDVRMMQSEAHSLRARASPNPNPAFNFSFSAPGPSNTNTRPAPKPPSKSHAKPPSTSKKSKHTLTYSLVEVSRGDTPQMDRNKRMREGAGISRSRSPAGMGEGEEASRQGKGGKANKHTRRRSSISNRGKRVSSLFEGGVISHPHTSVSDASFYKHIDCDLTESQRAQQLLIWCSARALSRGSISFSKADTSTNANTDSLRPLSDAQREILRAAQEDVIQMMATRKFEVESGLGASSNDSSSRSNILAALEDAATMDVETEKGKGKDIGENEQNVKNKAREHRFGAFIERAKAEEGAWLEVANFYNSYRTSVLNELEKSSSLVSTKSQGKQRATEELGEQDGILVVREDELPTAFRGEGVGLARSVLVEEKGDRRKSSLSERLEGLEFKIDSLHSHLNTALQTTNAASDDLDARFSLLSLVLASRSHSLPPPSSRPFAPAPHPHSLPNFLPGSRAHSQNRVQDPQDLLRALSRVDAERPPAQVGDAARRAAREVQRVVGEGGGVGVSERRLTNTGVVGTTMAVTPRKGKGMGTGTTPGRER